MARPAGAIDLSEMKSRIARYRAAAAKGKGTTRSAQDIRMILDEFNHAQAVKRSEPPAEPAG